MPISTGTPQELAFAESKVRVIKRMSTAMLAGAPHIDKKHWALADKQAVFICDFLPQQSRGNHCSFYMRTGRHVDWDLLQIKVFGAPTLYADPNGPIHKRSPIVERGFYVGCQWPAILVKRESDGKIIMVSRQKVRVHESLYIGPLSHLTTLDEIRSNIIGDGSSSEVDTTTSVGDSSNFDNVSPKPATDNNSVQSVKYLRNHRQKMIGTSKGKMLDIEESAMFGNVDSLHEGMYTDSVVCSDANKIAMEVEGGVKKGGIYERCLT
jgi:hypothetical protein